jgi:endoglucanase
MRGVLTLIVRSSIICLAGGIAMPAERATTDIKVDQVGYLPSAAKLAFVSAASPVTHFLVRHSNNGSMAFQSEASDAKYDLNSGDHVQTLDFSKLSEPGTYYIDIPGLGRSWDFRIGGDAYRSTYYLAMRSYYGQRCGIAVDLGPEFPGYSHAICHAGGAYHVSAGKSGPAATGQGWHDAGDYGRYVVNGGISTGTLLWTWEFFPDRIRSISLHIPESGNGTPDILSEARWNLDWMLSMQDADGGVWHKQTSDHFAGFIMPEKDKLTSYIIGTGGAPFKSSCATADLGAVSAIAARVFKTFDPGYSARCLRAAQLAYKWVEKNPAIAFSNPQGVTTGAYSDSHCEDERFWAAAELWRTTREPAYKEYVVLHAPEFMKVISSVTPPAWNSVAALGLWTYALSGDPSDTVNSIRQISIEAANAIVERSSADPYRISLTTDNYTWGSNSVVASYGVQLLIANRFKQERAYVVTALDNLHYLLGRNTLSLSFVTRVGQNPVRHPHHRPSGADSNAEPWPGLLAGGPNRFRQDPEMMKLPDLPPARMFLDLQGSYASNEVAINWNAPLVFLLAGLLSTDPAR